MKNDESYLDVSNGSFVYVDIVKWKEIGGKGVVEKSVCGMWTDRNFAEDSHRRHKRVWRVEVEKSKIFECLMLVRSDLLANTIYTV